MLTDFAITINAYYDIYSAYYDILEGLTMDINEINRKVFAELGKEKQLLEYHAIIYKLLNVVVDFINAEGESLKLSKMKNFNPYCSMIRSSKTGFAACQQCDQVNARSASLTQKELIYKCHAGLTEAVVPLFDQAKNYIGSMTTGQFKMEEDKPLNKAFINNIAGRYKLSFHKLFEAYRKTKVISKTQMDGIIDYLKSVGVIIVETHNKLMFLESVDIPDKIPLIKQFVKDNYMRPLTVPDTARKFFLSTGHFSRLFKKETGVSFMNFVNIYRASKAEDMLEKTRRNISEIALITGFGSISQFNRVFKSVRGMSPKEFRKNKVSERNSV